jgi:hypothetical protein
MKVKFVFRMGNIGNTSSCRYHPSLVIIAIHCSTFTDPPTPIPIYIQIQGWTGIASYRSRSLLKPCFPRLMQTKPFGI